MTSEQKFPRCVQTNAQRAAFYFLIATLFLLCPYSAIAAEGNARVEFSVDAPLAEVVRKLDTEQSLRQVLSSQGIELLAYKVTQRKLNLMTGTVDAKLHIDGLAPQYSSSPCQIEQTVRLGVTKATMQLSLLEPLGPLAELRYVIDIIAIEKRTRVEIEIDSRVIVPQRRLRFGQRLVDRMARRRVAKTLDRSIADLQYEIDHIVSTDRPAKAKSILLP